MGRPSQRNEILKEASQLFSRKGYHATTIREIAERRGILSGSLYAYISSKEDLLFDIVEEGANAFLSAIGHVKQTNVGPYDKIRNALQAHIEVVSTHSDAATVFFHEWRALSDERRAIVQAKRDAYERDWNELIHEGVREGLFRTGDAKFIRLLLLSVANWSYQWYRPNGPLSPRDIADEFIRIVVDANPSIERA